MKEYALYAKSRKDTLGCMFGAMFLIGISGMIILPHLMKQWSYDRRIGSLHILLGGVCFGVGITLLYVVFRNHIYKRTGFWKVIVLRSGMVYLISQLIFSCIMGCFGWWILRISRLDYEQVKWLIYLLASFFQNILRVGFVYLLVEEFYERNWKEGIFIGKRATVVILGLCVIMTLSALLPERNLQSVVTLLGQCIFLTGLMIYFGNRAWRRVTDEEKE